MWPAFTSVSSHACGSTTATTMVTNRSSHPWREKAALILASALAGSGSRASQNRTSLDSLAMRMAAETPLPATSPTTAAKRSSGSST